MRAPATNFFSLTPAADMQQNVLALNASNGDIIAAIKSLAPESTQDVQRLAPKFKKSTAEQTAFAIWYFLRTRAKYVRDSAELQQIRLPRRFLNDTLHKKNSGDCKSFALFTISILRALHMPAHLRFAGYNNGTHPSHVYAYTTDSTGREIIIDGCYPFFNREKKPTYIQNQNMTVTSLSGIAAGTPDQKRAAARKFLLSLSPRERSRVLQSYRRRCRVVGKGRAPKLQRIAGDEEDVIGAALVLGDEYAIAARAKKPKLTKEQKKAKRKKAGAKAKKGLKKFAWGVAFVNLLPIRAAFTAIVACNFNALAHNLKKVYENSTNKDAAKNTAKEWKKIEKIWYGLGGLKKALMKAITLGAAHKPLFLSKKAKARYTKRNKGTADFIGAICLDDMQGVGAAPVVAAAVAAAAGVIAAIIPALMSGLKKGGNKEAAADVQEQGVQMVQDYKAAGSPAPLSPAQVGQGAENEESEESEQVEGIHDFGLPKQKSALDNAYNYTTSNAGVGFDMNNAGTASLFETLGKVAQVGIQAAGTAVAKKAKKNPKLQKVLNTAGTASEDYFTGKYLRDAGYTGAAKKFSSAASNAGKYALYAGGAAVVALLGYLVIKKK